MLSRIKKRHIALMILLGLVAALGLFYFVSDQQKAATVIRPFIKEKDFEPLVKIVKDNLYWLSERPNFSAERFLLWRAPNFDPSRKGEAALDVIEFEGHSAGFISYYKKSSTHGFIWIFGVDEQFRRKGLGDKLMAHALKQLKSQGAQYVTLTTRLQKTPAIKLYQKHGFVELNREEDRGLITLINRNL